MKVGIIRLALTSPLPLELRYYEPSGDQVSDSVQGEEYDESSATDQS
jgi:hypothetical protein